MKNIKAIGATVGVLMFLAACGDGGQLQSRVQDLENEKAELATLNEKYKIEIEELQTHVQELENEAQGLRAVALSLHPDTGSMDTAQVVAVTPGATATSPTTTPAGPGGSRHR